MSILPETERALVDAARRRPAPLPWRRPAIAVVVACLAIGGLLLARSGRQVDHAARPHVVPGLAGVYSVFKRPRIPADEIPPGFRTAMADFKRTGITVFPQRSRLVALSGAYRAYAIPAARRGSAQVCALVSLGHGGGGMGCWPLSRTKPRTSRMTVPGASLVFALVPDGYFRARLRVAGGRVLERPVTGNGVLFAPVHGPRKLSITIR
jgi:hypothetical protein